ncbi:hypothetical protein ACTHGU_20740 [Chitinophagaceae bacterium MMS25-I14]
MKKFLRELKAGAIISLVVFVPYMTAVYLFVQWNIAQTDNLKEDDFSMLAVRIAAIGNASEKIIENRHAVASEFVLINSDVPKALWRIETDSMHGLSVGDTIEVRYPTAQLSIAISSTFSGRVQRFFSSYNNEVPVYRLSKGAHVLFEKEIHAYDQGTTSRGGLFMTAFTGLYIFVLSRLVRYMKRKDLWFKQ